MLGCFDLSECREIVENCAPCDLRWIAAVRFIR